MEFRYCKHKGCSTRILVPAAFCAAHAEATRKRNRAKGGKHRQWR